MCKKYFLNAIILLLSFNVNLIAQVGIGTNIVSPGVLMEFNNNCSSPSCVSTNAKGIILPILTNSLSNNFINGTFILDESDKMLKVYENNTWRKLSYSSGDLGKVITPKTSVEIGGGVYIGDHLNEDNISTGVLELNSTDKVLVLPIIHKPYETVENPYPGMMCYDIDSKSLMIFDGKFWNIWKKERKTKILTP